MKIGSVELENNVFLAPMAGVTDKVFRTICREMGCGLVYSEMVSAKGMRYNNKNTTRLLEVDPMEKPCAVQIFGSEPDVMADMARRLNEYEDIAIIDINMGCPVNKVVKTDAGARWLLDPNKVYEMVSYVTDAVKKPVTVKMRTGWDDKHILAVENALAAERAGASAIAMHGRTRKQMYTGQADWNILKEVASQLKIPFMANGDVKTPEDAKKILDMTGATAAMIGRAAMGNPWMLKRTEHYLETGELLPEATPEQKIEMAKDHLNRLVDLKGEYVGVREFRGLSTYYIKGIPRAARTKVALVEAETLDEMNDIFDRFAEQTAERAAKRQQA